MMVIASTTTTTTKRPSTTWHSHLHMNTTTTKEHAAKEHACHEFFKYVILWIMMTMLWMIVFIGPTMVGKSSGFTPFHALHEKFVGPLDGLKVLRRMFVVGFVGMLLHGGLAKG
jgi:hypothetical protein